MGQGLCLSQSLWEGRVSCLSSTTMFCVNKPYFSTRSGRNLKVLNFTAVNTKNPFQSIETKPQAGKTWFALRAFGKLTLALQLDHRSLALIPCPSGDGWRGSGPLLWSQGHTWTWTYSCKWSWNVWRPTHRASMSQLIAMGVVTGKSHSWDTRDTGQDPGELAQLTPS